MAKMTGRWIEASTITDTNLATGAVTNGKLGTGAVTPGKMDLTQAYTFASTLRASSIPSHIHDVINKQYADGLISGLDLKASVRAATTATLVATYLGTPNFTLTADDNGAIALDGVTDLTVGQRVLVKDQTDDKQNGIYTVTQVGDVSNPFILTRAADFDTSEEVTSGAFTFVSEGDTQEATGWTVISPDPITVDVDAVEWYQHSGAGSYLAGAGLTLTGNEFAIDADAIAGDGLTASGDELQVNPYAGADTAIVPADVSSDGVGIKTDDTTLENNAGTIRVKGGYAHTHSNKSNLDAIDQDLATTDDVAFAGLTVPSKATPTDTIVALGDVLTVNGYGDVLTAKLGTLGAITCVNNIISTDGNLQTGDSAEFNVDKLGEITAMKYVKDNVLKIVNSTTPSKAAYFSCASIADATTRTFTFPNANGTLALTSDIPAAAKVKKVYLHKVTSGEVTQGYFTLSEAPAVAGVVTAYAVGGGVQVNKAVVASTGQVPDFEMDSTNTTRLYFMNEDSHTGLSASWLEDDVIQVEYTA